MAFAGCGLPVLRACVLLLSVKLGKSEQLREAGNCFPLPSVAGKLLCNIGSQAPLHHNRRFGIPVLVFSRAGSPSHAVGPLWDLAVKDRQVTSRERGVQGPCFSFLKGAEAGRCPLGSVAALGGLSSLAAPALAGEVLALSLCPRVIPAPRQLTDQTFLLPKPLIP